MTREDDDFLDELPTSPVSLRARVLVVEDDDRLRELVVLRMRRMGYDVLEAGSGDEAIDVFSMTARGTSYDVDLVVTDVRMPGTTGLELARLVRLVDGRIPILVITAFPDQAVIDEAAKLHVALLAKPFALDRLSEAAIELMAA